MSPVLPRRSFLKSFRYSSNLSIHLPNMWSAAMVRIPWPDKLLRKARSTTVRFASVGLGGGFHIPPDASGSLERSVWRVCRGLWREGRTDARVIRSVHTAPAPLLFLCTSGPRSSQAST